MHFTKYWLHTKVSDILKHLVVVSYIYLTDMKVILIFSSDVYKRAFANILNYTFKLLIFWHWPQSHRYGAIIQSQYTCKHEYTFVYIYILTHSQIVTHIRRFWPHYCRFTNRITLTWIEIQLHNYDYYPLTFANSFCYNDGPVRKFISSCKLTDLHLTENGIMPGSPPPQAQTYCKKALV